MSQNCVDSAKKNQKHLTMHQLNECPCFQQARFDTLHNQPIINTTKWDSADIIAFSHIPAIDAALTFE